MLDSGGCVSSCRGSVDVIVSVVRAAACDNTPRLAQVQQDRTDQSDVEGTEIGGHVVDVPLDERRRGAEGRDGGTTHASWFRSIVSCMTRCLSPGKSTPFTGSRSIDTSKPASKETTSAPIRSRSSSGSRWRDPTRGHACPRRPHHRGRPTRDRAGPKRRAAPGHREAQLRGTTRGRRGPRRHAGRKRGLEAGIELPQIPLRWVGGQKRLSTARGPRAGPDVTALAAAVSVPRRLNMGRHARRGKLQPRPDAAGESAGPEPGRAALETPSSGQ